MGSMNRERIIVDRGPSYLTTGARQPRKTGSKFSIKWNFLTMREITRVFCGAKRGTASGVLEVGSTGGSYDGCLALSANNIFTARMIFGSSLGTSMVRRVKRSRGKPVSERGGICACCRCKIAQGISVFGQPTAPLCRLIPVLRWIWCIYAAVICGVHVISTSWRLGTRRKLIGWYSYVSLMPWNVSTCIPRIAR